MLLSVAARSTSRAALSLVRPASTSLEHLGRRRGRQMEVMRVGADGGREEMNLHLSEVLQSTSLHARDLNVVGSRKQAIYPMPGCIVVNLSHMNVLIQHDGGMIFDYKRPSVLSFMEDLDHRMASQCQTEEVLHRMEGLTTAETEEEGEEGEGGAAGEIGGTEGGERGERKLAFELQLLEAILDTVSEKYERRLRCYSTVTRGLLEDLHVSVFSARVVLRTRTSTVRCTRTTAVPEECRWDGWMKRDGWAAGERG